MITLFTYVFTIASIIIAGWVVLEMVGYIRIAFRDTK
jgi:hypothetical protein